MLKHPKLFRRINFCLVILLFLFGTNQVSCQQWDGVIISQADYQGLQAFKQSLQDPRGFLKSWNDSGFGACSGGWDGIKCVKGKVIAIQLPYRGLGGHITEKIGQLTALRKLSLHDNFVSGQIPAALGFLRDLRGVYLFNNQLSGSIPASIGNCISLQTLDLSNNSLVGTIPSSISNASNLYRFNLSYNNLSGGVPVGLNSLVSLTFLSLQHNNFSGLIPDSWGNRDVNVSRSYQLQTLNLDHNFFSGNIPLSLGKLPFLTELTLDHNQLNGSFPASLTNLSSLSILNLEDNRLEGRIPESIDALQSLSVLSLKRNSLSGGIPASLGDIPGISQLDLSDNSLTGEIPASLNSLSNLTFFNVSNNNLSGAVPALLSQKFNASSFAGNIQLCGYSVTVPCPWFPTTNTPPPPSIKPAKSRNRKLSTKDIILIIAGVALLLLLLCCLLLCCLLKRKTKASGKKSTAAGRGEKPGPGEGTEVEASGSESGGKLVHFDGPLAFTADDLLCATAEIMGKSTYGTMYKATLEDGSQVAVKRLRERTAKGHKEFETEVNLLGRIRHPNLLALRAYYMGPKGEKLLVFDYMPKGSLASFLHARGPETAVDWATRMKIVMGTATGLRYLHKEANMVHGHLTSSNVLLDENTNAKIADFGLSRLMTSAASSNVIAAAGALGYRAPELSKLKKANTKTDVYSLGVIMLELLTGKSPSEAMNGVDLPQWVASIVKEEWTNEVFDLELMKEAEGSAGDELLNVLKLALHCVDPSPAARPEVQQVLQQLEQIKPEITSIGSEGGASTSKAAGPSTAAE